MHLKFNPTMPDLPAHLFIGKPDENGNVQNHVNHLFRRAVIQWGRGPDVVDAKGRVNSPRKYATAYLATYQNEDQVSDIGDFFPLDDEQAKAVSLGTPAVRFLHAITLPAMDADGHPAIGGGTAFPGPNADGEGGVTFANPQSLWDKKVAEVQHNLNAGYDGTKTGTGVDAGL